jgi:hypothetical protein
MTEHPAAKRLQGQQGTDTTMKRTMQMSLWGAVVAAGPKRGYSRDFPIQSDDYGRYLLDKIPATLWKEVRAKARREGVSVRALLLGKLKDWVENERRDADEPARCPVTRHRVR